MATNEIDYLLLDLEKFSEDMVDALDAVFREEFGPITQDQDIALREISDNFEGTSETCRDYFKKHPRPTCNSNILNCTEIFQRIHNNRTLTK